jgi:hypothetical protein
MSALTPETVERLERFGIPVDSPLFQKLDLDIRNHLEIAFKDRENWLASITNRDIKAAATQFSKDKYLGDCPADGYRTMKALEKKITRKRSDSIGARPRKTTWSRW